MAYKWGGMNRGMGVGVGVGRSCGLLCYIMLSAGY